MKRILTFYLLVFFKTMSFGQLTDGTTAPDFTFIDINGNTQNLYSYLDSGKYVALDISATWCHPCWEYHESHVFDSLYLLHDLPGDNTWKVLFLEGDGSTSLADLNGTGTSTQGDWVSGTTYPIMNPSGTSLNDFLTSYNNVSFPTLYLICPNRKLYYDTLNAVSRGSVSTWEYVASTSCDAVSIRSVNIDGNCSVYPNPAKGRTTIAFNLKSPSKLRIEISDMLGRNIDTRSTEQLSVGEHPIQYDLSNCSQGTYLLTIYSNEGVLWRSRLVVR